MKATHYVQVTIVALIAAATAVSGADPALAPYAHGVSLVLTTVLGLLGLTSPAVGASK